MNYAEFFDGGGSLVEGRNIMAKDKKVEQITDMEQDFAQWFTDVCVKAEIGRASCRERV